MDKYINFLNQYNYDVRKTGDARWIDQKCTFDVLSIIADCILEYTSGNEDVEFTTSDIWHNDYARENVIDIFSKPDPETEAKNEYDKYFSQPIKLLGYSKVLNVRKSGARYYYSIGNKSILEDIAYKNRKSLEFLTCYIEKVLNDSGLLKDFYDFLNRQTPDSYFTLKRAFTLFTIENTNIKGETECGRIFAKVLNPLAFKYKRKGTERGRISKNNILLMDLQYNRTNWRDELSGKDKSMTRNEFLASKPVIALANYSINKAKKELKLYNQRFNQGYSEVSMPSENGIMATQAHHIFPQNEFPTIADYIENLIMLTPNQHFTMAHPDNNTRYIDKAFQYVCLMEKWIKISKDILGSSKEKFYNFEDYKNVLAIGIGTDEFNGVQENDFYTINNLINYYFPDCNNSLNNRYLR